MTRRPRYCLASLTGTMLAAAALASPASGAVDDVVRASVSSTGQQLSAPRFSQFPSVSENGCRIAFQASIDTVNAANNLTADDPTLVPNVDPIQIYLRDQCAMPPTTTLVSRNGLSGAMQSRGAPGSPGNTPLEQPAISADGKWVAWTSNATNLGTTPAAACASMFDCTFVFAREIQTGDTRLVSVDETGTASVTADFFSGTVDISDDGRYVTWVSQKDATTIDPAATSDPTRLPTNGDHDVFRWDRDSPLPGKNQLVSHIPGAYTTGNNVSRQPSISGGGSRVVWESTATNLTAEDTNPNLDVLMRDMSTPAPPATSTQLISKDSAGTPADGASQTGRISADGKSVVFSSNAPLFGGGSQGTAESSPKDVMLIRDLDVDPLDPMRTPNTTEVVNRISGEDGQRQQAGTVGFGDPSEDGRFIAFDARNTGATPLAEGANAGAGGTNTYLRDRLNQTTFLASRASGGIGPTALDTTSQDAKISDDGDFVAFSSTTPLTPDDTNGNVQDVFRREFGEPGEVQTGQTVNLRLLAGSASIAGTPFEHSTQVPVGTYIDATNGRIELTSDNALKDSMRFFGGDFIVNQQLTVDPVTDLNLMPVTCPAPAAPVVRKKRKKKKKKKRNRAAIERRATSSLFGSGKGRFRTRGYRGAATVRGTDWNVQDTCAGTLITLNHTDDPLGLEIDDFGVAGPTDAVLHGDGQTYLAAAPPQAAPSAPVKKKRKKRKKKKK